MSGMERVMTKERKQSRIDRTGFGLLRGVFWLGYGWVKGEEGREGYVGVGGNV